MAERSAFLDAIRADPEADAPRLIYADWLDENGDPERAAFIRYQVALGDWTPDAWGTVENPFEVLRHRFGLAKSERAARATLSPLGRFVRGFVETYEISKPAAADEFERLREIEPLPHLRFGLAVFRKSIGNPATLAALCDAPILTLQFDRRTLKALRGTTFRCRRLMIELDDSFDGSSGTEFSQLDFPELRNLSIGSEYVNCIGPGTLKSLFDRSGSRLRSLELAGIEDDDDHAAFAALEWPAELDALDLRRWDLQTVGYLIEQRRLPAARRSSLRFEARALDLDLAASPAFLDWPGWAGVREFELDGDFGDSPLLNRLASLTPDLESLFLTGDTVGHLDVRAWPRLRSLSLDFAGIAEEPSGLIRGAIALAARVERLHVRYPPADFFAGPEWRANSPLTELRITCARDAEIRTLAELPALAGLEVLDLNPEGGGTCSVGALNALARSAFGPNLKALNINHRSPGKMLRTAAEKHFGPRCDLYWSKG